MNKNSLYHLYFIILISTTICLSEWKQQKFVIGSYYDPRMSGNIEDDNSRLKIFTEANFNLLSGINDEYNSYSFNHNGIPPHPYRLANPDGVSNTYLLKRVAEINKEHKKTILRTLIRDSEFYWYPVNNNGDYNPDKLHMVTLEKYTNLPKHLRNAIYGYFLKDEPPDNRNQLNKIFIPLITRARSIDPEKLAFVNCHPYGKKRPSNYKNHIDYYSKIAKNSQVLSSDMYNWSSYDGKKESRQLFRDLFDGYKFLSETANRYKIPLWIFVASVECYKTDKAGKFFKNHRMALGNAELRFNAFAPIVYGAKGIIWFTYDSPCNPFSDRSNGGLCPGVSHTNAYHGAILSSKTGEPTEKYNLIKQINNEIINMGSILMKLEWITTIHGDKKNNIPCQNNLPTITENTPAIAINGIYSGVHRNSVAVGIFKGQAPYKWYIMVLNKDIENKKNNIRLTYKKPYATHTFDKIVNKWNIKYINSTEIWLDLGPGDMALMAIF